jgi:hypothetical protein
MEDPPGENENAGNRGSGSLSISKLHMDDFT